MFFGFFEKGFSIFMQYTIFGRLLGWLMPKQKAPTPQDLQTPPTTKQGSPVPIVFGQQLHENSYLVDYGNIKTTAIRAKGGKK